MMVTILQKYKLSLNIQENEEKITKNHSYLITLSTFASDLVYFYVIIYTLRLKARLTHCLDTLAEIVEDTTVFGPLTDVDAAACWQETTHDSLDMSAYIKLLGFFYTNTLNA